MGMEQSEHLQNNYIVGMEIRTGFLPHLDLNVATLRGQGIDSAFRQEAALFSIPIFGGPECQAWRSLSAFNHSPL